MTESHKYPYSLFQHYPSMYAIVSQTSRNKKISVFYDVTSCSVVESYQHFRGKCCLWLWFWRWRQQIPPECWYLPDYMVSSHLAPRDNSDTHCFGRLGCGTRTSHWTGCTRTAQCSVLKQHNAPVAIAFVSSLSPLATGKRLCSPCPYISLIL
jgi:hypothetical protein